MHLLCPENASLSENLKTIIRESDQIYFEINLADISELISGVMNTKMKNDTLIENLYTPEEYKRVKDFFASHGMSMEFNFMRGMEPTLVSALVDQAMLPCAQSDGMELNILQESKKYNKEIKGLETAAFQAGIIDKIPYKEQAKELLNDVDSFEMNKEEMNEMISLYKKQDIDSLLSYTLNSDTAINNMQDIMINQRNTNWANQFPVITNGKQLLIAVGAGHLGGNKGLLNLLRQRGYTVKAIEN
jgi:uncharacterized protein YbaP (TraB family)